MSIGTYIRVKRCAAKLNLRDVADQIGISHVALGEIERGVRQPKPERLAQLERAIPGFSLAELERVVAGEVPAPELPRQDLGAAIVRRLEQRDIKTADMLTLHRLLLGGE